MFKKIFKRTMLVLLAALVIIQFFHPKRNKADGPQNNYIGNTYNVPADVKIILAKACNDCHSNNTVYPWYTNIQPVHWFLDNHIRNGKNHLNFDEYTSRNLRFQYNKMGDLKDEVKDGGMPLNSYTWIHKDARLSEAEKTSLMNWADAIMDTLKAKYPLDSLIRKK
jgi:Haem-binding domain